MTESLIENLSKFSSKAVNYFLKDLQFNGSYRTEATDLACYFKSPMMFLAAGYERQANDILDYIKNTFLFNGDLLTSNDKKSAEQEYVEYWIYINGWIARAAQKLNRTDLMNAIRGNIDAYSSGNGGYLTHRIETNKDGITDMLTTAHLGLLQLERGNIERAMQAGDYILKVFEKQSDLTNGFFLRLDENDHLITDYPSDMSWAYIVKKNEPKQAYFMIGYPIAFLTFLYEKTNEMKYLKCAKDLMNFALSCHEDVYSSNMSHKLAWAAALLLQHDDQSKEKYLNLIERVFESFARQQSEDGLLPGSINTTYDESSETAYWFLETARILNQQAK